MSKKFWIILLSAIVVLGGIIGLTIYLQEDSVAPSTPQSTESTVQAPPTLYVHGNDVVDADGHKVYGYYLNRDGDIIDSEGRIIVPAEERGELSAIESVQIIEDLDGLYLMGRLTGERDIAIDPAEFYFGIECSPADCQNALLYLEVRNSGDIVFVGEEHQELGRSISLSVEGGQEEICFCAYHDGPFELIISNGFGQELIRKSVIIGARTEPLNPCESEHEYEEAVVSASLWSPGYILHVCKKCGFAYKDTYTQVAEHVHSWSIKSVIEPSYIAAGYTLEECEICHQQQKSNPTQKLFCEHGEDISIVIEPSCTEEGYTLHECSICRNFSWKDDYTPATGHTMIEEETPATYEHGKMVKRVCKVCGFEESATEVSEPLKCRHSHTEKKRIKPTCNESGYTLHYCVKCGYSYTDSKKDPLGHHFKKKVIATTAETEGYTLYTCDRCGYSYKDDYVDKLGN